MALCVLMWFLLFLRVFLVFCARVFAFDFVVFVILVVLWFRRFVVFCCVALVCFAVVCFVFVLVVSRTVGC